MSEPTPTAQPAAATAAATAPGGTEFAPIQSQEDFDRRIQDRLARERAKYSDYDTLKSAAGEFEQFKEASKTEQQKAIDAAKSEGAQEATGKFTKRIMNAEIKATAASLGFTDPGDAIALFGDTSKITFTDEGPDAEAIKTRLTEIATSKAYLIKAEPGPKVGTRPRAKAGSETDSSNKPTGKSRAAAALREFSGTR